MALARRATSSSSRPQHTTSATERMSVDGSRPSWAQASLVRSNMDRLTSTVPNGTLSSAANRAASAGVRRGPCPPTMIGGWGTCRGLGKAGLSFN